MNFDDEKNFSKNLPMLIRTVFSSVGGPLSGFANLWNEIEQKQSEKNILLLINSLKAITACHSNEINHLQNDIEKSKQALISLEKIVQNLRFEWEESKIPQYAIIAWHCFTSPESLDKKLQIIDQFSRLSVKDVELLQQFEKGKKTIKELCRMHYEKDYIHTIIPSIVKLTSNWLLEETINEIDGFDVIPTKSSWEGKCFLLTSYGKVLLDLIKPIKENC